MTDTYEWNVRDELAKAKSAANRQRTNRATIHGLSTATKVQTPSTKAPFIGNASENKVETILDVARSTVVDSVVEIIAAANRKVSIYHGFAQKPDPKHNVRFCTEADTSDDYKFAAFLAMNSAEMGYTTAATLAAAVRWGLRDMDVVNHRVINHSTKPAGFDDALIRFKTYFDGKSKIVNFLSNKTVAHAIIMGVSVREIARMCVTESEINEDDFYDLIGVSVLTDKNAFRTIFGFSILPYLTASIVRKRTLDAEIAAVAVLGTASLITGGPNSALELLLLTRRIIMDMLEEGFMDASTYNPVGMIPLADEDDAATIAEKTAKNGVKVIANLKRKLARSKLVRFKLDCNYLVATIGIFCKRATPENSRADAWMNVAGYNHDITVGVNLAVVAAAYVTYKSSTGDHISTCFQKLVDLKREHYDSYVKLLKNAHDVDCVTQFVNEYLRSYVSELDALFANE